VQRNGGRGVAVVATMVAAAVWASAAQGRSATRVTVGSAPNAQFPQDKQNEPAVAIDPVRPQLVAAGANDWIDVGPCAEEVSGCVAPAAVGGSGVYLSTDGGTSWVQPQYTGLTARDCSVTARCRAHWGPIGTLPGFAERGLVSAGDPSLAFGPAPDGRGGFSWAAGSRLYYATLAARADSQSEEGLDESFSVAVSSTDDIPAAAAGQDDAWTPPVLAASPDEGHTYDKDAVWADDAATSPYFGRVYVCAAFFGSYNSDSIAILHSQDGGATWSKWSGFASPTGLIWQGCTLRTDSHGVLFAFWLESSVWASYSRVMLARSTDGGVHFSTPVALARVSPVGIFDPLAGALTFSGIGGARTNNMPSVDIANGAPTGADATNAIAVAWTNGPTPRARSEKRNERVDVLFSRSDGAGWASIAGGSPLRDRPDMPAVALSPDGKNLYLVYDNFLQPWEQSASRRPQLMQGVVRHAAIGLTGRPAGWSDVERSPSGDVRATSSIDLQSAFIGDYNAVAATRDSGVALWNDVRAAADCPAVDRYRQSLADGASPWGPAPSTACPPGFGNSDVFGLAFGP
jgi:hypothetical protein